MPIANLLYIGDTAELYGGFTLSQTNSAVSLTVKLQKFVSSNPEVWSDFYVFTTVSGISVIGGVEKSFKDANGGIPYRYVMMEAGLFRWCAIISTIAVTQTFNSDFDVLAAVAEGGSLSIVGVSSASVTLRYYTGINFATGILRITDLVTGLKTVRDIDNGTSVISGLKSDTLYQFYVEAYNLDDMIGSISNVIQAETTSIVPPTPTPIPVFTGEIFFTQIGSDEISSV